jgi:glyoxylase-like metal-dependent hydrolase (beta-lactamase superfamily II)
VLLLAPSALSAQHPAPAKTEIANGIYLFATAPYGDVGLDGNSVVIISSDGVLVFDSNGTEAAAAAVLAQIRALTKQPVRYVVNSHWHWDHWYGTEVYRRAFPNVQVIAHEKTRTMMLGPAIAFNRPALATQLPEHIRAVEKALAELPRGAEPSRRARLERHLANDRFFLGQKRNAVLVPPTLTYHDSLTIYLGPRRIQLLHYDRAVTPGDTFLYLPDDKIVIAGDLVVNPVPFALVCYPTGWLRTLEQMERLDATVIVPGHGGPLRDKALLHAQIEAFQALLREGKAARERGLDPDQARAEVRDRIRGIMAPFVAGDSVAAASVDVYLTDWYLHRVYDELAGNLTDEIGPVPSH